MKVRVVQKGAKRDREEDIPIGCKFIDELSREVGYSLDHKHYDPVTKTFHNNEHVPHFSMAPVCGYYLNEGDIHIVFELLDDVSCGNPSLFGVVENAEERFIVTQKRLNLLYDLKYMVIYAWLSEYKDRGARAVHQICRTFNGELEWLPIE